MGKAVSDLLGRYSYLKVFWSYLQVCMCVVVASIKWTLPRICLSLLMWTAPCPHALSGIPSPPMALLTLELSLRALVRWPLTLNRPVYHLSFALDGKSVWSLLLGI